MSKADKLYNILLHTQVFCSNKYFRNYKSINAKQLQSILYIGWEKKWKIRETVRFNQEKQINWEQKSKRRKATVVENDKKTVKIGGAREKEQASQGKWRLQIRSKRRKRASELGRLHLLLFFLLSHSALTNMLAIYSWILRSIFGCLLGNKRTCRKDKARRSRCAIFLGKSENKNLLASRFYFTKVMLISKKRLQNFSIH